MPAIHFKAELIALNGYTLLRLPADASLRLPSRGQVMVRGAVNGGRFQTAVEPDGNGGHWLNADAALLAAAKAEAGDTVAVEIEATRDWPEPVIPDDLRAALSAEPEADRQWQSVTPMARWEWIRWVNSTGQAETRSHRLKVACSKLMNGERRPCCFNRNMCCVPAVSKSGVLIGAR